MELFIFARFHARPGNEAAVEQAILEVIAPTREEQGCLRVHAFRSTRNPATFYIHSRWLNEDVFEQHIALPHTVRFIERVQPLIDHPFEAARTKRIG